jgi:hypothetical protein
MKPNYILFLCVVYWHYQGILGQCPLGAYSGLESKCYTLPLSKMSWWDAEQACWDVDGNLTSIADATFNNFVHNMTGNLANSFWAGATNVINGMWQWSDGTPFNYTNWQTGYEVKINRTCLAIQPSSGKWLKEKCHEEKPFMCTVPIVPREEPTLPSCPACPSQSTLQTTLVTCPPAVSVPTCPSCPSVQPVPATSEPCPVCTTETAAVSQSSCPPQAPVPTCPAPPPAPQCPQAPPCPSCPQCQQPDPTYSYDCCPPGWTYLSETDMCHALSISDTWINVWDKCYTDGYAMTSIHSDAQNQALLNFATQNGYGWVHVGLFNNGSGLFWADSTDAGYARQFSNWAGTDPAHTSPQFCVMADSQGPTWATINCFSGTIYPGLCERFTIPCQ